MKEAVWTVCQFFTRRHDRLSHLIYKVADTYVRSYKNLNYDMNSNGEFRLLDNLSNRNIGTVFDVGANEGDYALACLSRFPVARVHAFEIVPATYGKLQAKLGSSERAVLNAFGLSDKAGSMPINYDPAIDKIASVVEGVRSIFPFAWQTLQVEVSTGDAYCELHDIVSIDLLKIDVEGAEHLVLEGFRKTLAAGKISAIQFEYGMTNIYTRFLLQDFWSLLTAYGFVVGPIMPNGVNFKDYDPRHEDFQGPPNFFAVHASRSDLIEAVRCR